MFVDAVWSTRGLFHQRSVVAFFRSTSFDIVLFVDTSSTWKPDTPKKNARAFGGTGTTASPEWFDFKLPNCVDFDQPGM